MELMICHADVMKPSYKYMVWRASRLVPLEKGMVTHSRILAWRIPGTEESGGLQSMGSQKLDTTELVTLHSLERGGQVGRDRGRGWSRWLGPL